MTAKEYLKKACKDAGFSEDYSEMIFRIMPDSSSTYVEAMIEHTKYHVQKALEKAAENVTIEEVYEDYCKDHTPFWGVCSSCGNYHNPKVLVGKSVDKSSILNAYPIENIK